MSEDNRGAPVRAAKCAIHGRLAAPGADTRRTVKRARSNLEAAAGVRAFTSAMVVGVNPPETTVYGRCDPGDHRKAGALPPPDASETSSERGLSEATWQLECAECERRTLLTGAVAGLSRKVVSRCYV